MEFDVNKTQVFMSALYKLLFVVVVVLLVLFVGSLSKDAFKKQQGGLQTHSVVMIEKEKTPEKNTVKKVFFPKKIVQKKVITPVVQERVAQPEIVEEKVIEPVAQKEEVPAPKVIEEKAVEPIVVKEEPSDASAEKSEQEVKEENAVVIEKDAILIQKEVDVIQKKYIAIVIDDMGISPKRTSEIISIKAPLTSSFLTYGKNLEELYQEASKAGHEIMVHVAMEPIGKANLAPDTLKVDMTDSEVEKLFLGMLSKFKNADIKGVNNHMGSRFTQNEEKLDVVMKMLKAKNLFFLDSKTTADSKGKEVAQKEGVDYISRDVFLDNENDEQYIKNQLQRAEKIAQKRGYAVAIGHPKSKTFEVLKNWIPTLDQKGLELVRLSDMMVLINKKN